MWDFINPVRNWAGFAFCCCCGCLQCITDFISSSIILCSRIGLKYFSQALICHPQLSAVLHIWTTVVKSLQPRLSLTSCCYYLLARLVVGNGLGVPCFGSASVFSRSFVARPREWFFSTFLPLLSVASKLWPCLELALWGSLSGPSRSSRILIVLVDRESRGSGLNLVPCLQESFFSYHSYQWVFTCALGRQAFLFLPEWLGSFLLLMREEPGQEEASAPAFPTVAADLSYLPPNPGCSLELQHPPLPAVFPVNKW